MAGASEDGCLQLENQRVVIDDEDTSRWTGDGDITGFEAD